MRLLLVEDDAELAGRLRDALDGAGFAVDVADDGESALMLGRSEDYDAIILDLGLPSIPGAEVLQRWRAAGVDVPVLVLSARSSWAERVEGLNTGADDYLGKPFQAEELIARLRALLRRSAGRGSPLLRYGDIVIDEAAGTASLAGEPVAMTARDLRIIIYLLHRRGQIVLQDQLAAHIYSLEEVRDSNTIEVYISRLRKKFGRDLIRTVRGLGYRID